MKFPSVLTVAALAASIFWPGSHSLTSAAAAADFEYCGAPSTLPANPATTGMTLLQVQFVIRHGDRVPLFKVPAHSVDWLCEPFATSGLLVPDGSHLVLQRKFLDTPDLGPSCQFGELTTRGRDQHIALGAAMRKKYIEGLGLTPAALTETNLKQIFVRSTDFSRTRQSAMAFLAGLYPAEHRPPTPKLNPVVTGSVPILHTRSAYSENMTPNGTACPALEKLLTKEFPASQTATEIMKNPLIETVANKLGITFNEKHPASSVKETFESVKKTFESMDNIYSRVCHRKTLPQDLTEDEISKMLDLQNQAQGALSTFDAPAHQAARLGIGTFLGQIREKMGKSASGKNVPKIVLWSGHDTTIWPLLTTLGIDNAITLPYASIMAFELWQKEDKQPWVAVGFNGNYLSMSCGDPQKSTLCRLPDFQSMIEPFIPTDFKTECAATDASGVRGPTGRRFLAFRGGG